MMKKASPGIDGHVLFNPIDPNSYMGMICYKNASLMREKIRDSTVGSSWDDYEEIL